MSWRLKFPAWNYTRKQLLAGWRWLKFVNKLYVNKCLMWTTWGNDLAPWNSSITILKSFYWCCGGVISLIPALDSEFLSVLSLAVAVQPTDDIILLSGRNSRQTTYNNHKPRVGEQDWPLTRKHLETYLLSNAYVELSQSGTVYTS